MNIEKIKNWWKARKFWEKGIVLGILLFPILNLDYFFYFQLHYGSPLPKTMSFYGFGVNTYMAFIISFLITVFVIFGLGFRLSEFSKSYVVRGSFIGAWITFVSSAPAVLVAISMTKFEPFQVISYITPFVYNIFAGSIIGLFYERWKNKGKLKSQQGEEIPESIKGEAKGWAKLRFWHKGVIMGIIVYLLILSVIAFGGEGIDVAFSVAGWSFVLIVFGMFGLGFKIAERSKKYYMRGFIIGNWLPVPPILLLLSLIIIYHQQRLYGSGSILGVIVIMLIIAMPILGSIGALVGYVYGWLGKGEVDHEVRRNKKPK